MNFRGSQDQSARLILTAIPTSIVFWLRPLTTSILSGDFSVEYWGSIKSQASAGFR
ncbi:MAG: hypothetical protein LBF88_10485 [Planctomycetaceae bacterium]|nr:hypothetical protein [Planctomycetaceae bacterium]